MKKIEAVIFDIDGTLSPENSWIAFTRDIGASTLNHLEIYRQHRDGEIEYEESREKLTKLWIETGRVNRQYIEHLYDSWPIQPEAIPLIDWLKNNDYLTCLITGSVIDYAKHVAEKVGADDYYASGEFHYDSKGDFIGFDYVLDQAALKTEHLDDFCDKQDINPEQCIAVGDSWNDLALFKKTGNGLLIGDTKNEELVRAAREKIGSLNEIKTILESNNY